MLTMPPWRGMTQHLAPGMTDPGSFQMTWAVIALFGIPSASLTDLQTGTLRSNQREPPPSAGYLLELARQIASLAYRRTHRLHYCSDRSEAPHFFKAKRKREALPYLFCGCVPPRSPKPKLACVPRPPQPRSTTTAQLSLGTYPHPPATKVET